MNKNIIKIGDCLKLFKDLDSESIDLIIADPPYNLGKNYGNNHDLKGFDEYLEFTQKWLNESKRVLKKDGTIYVFMGVRFISYLYEILDCHLQMFFNSWIVWHYTQGLGKTKGFSPRHDDILMFNKSKNFKFYLDKVRIPQKYYRNKNNMQGANPGDVWQFSHVHYCNKNRQDHPTQKPEGLIERMVLASSDEGDTVLDPFAGSGTTLRVCQQLNRISINFEINPAYLNIMNQRLKTPFYGFDSIDPRIQRVPKDLNNSQIRQNYLNFHQKQFLQNHKNSLPKFKKEVEKMYTHKMSYTESQQVLKKL